MPSTLDVTYTKVLIQRSAGDREVSGAEQVWAASFDMINGYGDDQASLSLPSVTEPLLTPTGKMVHTCPPSAMPLGSRPTPPSACVLEVPHGTVRLHPNTHDGGLGSQHI